MRVIYVRIDGTAERCHRQLIPKGTGPGTTEHKAYPEGTCPYFFQWPNGTKPVCACAPEGINVSLERDADGFALRSRACKEAEHRNGEKRARRVYIAATAQHCNEVPFLEPIPKHPEDPRKRNGTGSPVVFPVGCACGGIMMWPAGGTYCHLKMKSSIGFLRRDAEGNFQRLEWCKDAEKL